MKKIFVHDNFLICRPREGGDPSWTQHCAKSNMDPRLRGDDKINFCRVQRIKITIIALVSLFVSGLLILFFSPVPPLLNNISFSQAIYDDHHKLLRLTLSKDDKYRLFTPLSDISNELIDATLLQEDQYFRNHYGINPVSMVNAIVQTYVFKSRRVGASTITMQLARIRYGIHSKTISGKLWQIIKAIQIEMHYSKDQILEAYLNLAPYGGNIEGVGAASQIYFKNSVNKITLPEALTLSVIPQNPNKRSPGSVDTLRPDNPRRPAACPRRPAACPLRPAACPRDPAILKNAQPYSHRDDRNGSREQVAGRRELKCQQKLKDIRDALFARWLIQHPGDSDKKAMFNLPLVMHTTHSLPFNAPHFVNMILNDPSLRQQQNINTTLDTGMQTIIDRITRLYLARKQTLGVNNAAVMLVDTRDMGIKGLIGSGDFFNQRISGQINGTETKRSPGSTLKPFIYGLALDQGLIHPNTVLNDVPHSFNGYNPENFDYDFMGPIKAKDALVLSRNIPAVFLSSQLSNPTLHQLLEKAQVSRLKSESWYGLSLNLGGVELTMRELVGLYAMLVNEGVWYPVANSLLPSGRRCHEVTDEGVSVRYVPSDDTLIRPSLIRPSGTFSHWWEKGTRLLSPEASFLVLDMLKNTPRHQSGPGNISWKTGTSSGYRDAWAVGSFGPYVLAVWIGNFDNKSNPAFVGKDIAAPLFFELIDAIKQERGPIPKVDPNPEHMNLKKVAVCKASGMLPTRYCTDTESTWFIPGKSPIKTDTIFREVAINNATGLRTCHINQNTRFEVFEFWPSDLLKIFKRAGIQRHTPPFFEPDCALSGINGLTPQITSPQSGVSYVVRANSQQNNTVPLSAVTDGGVEYVYWFINETFIVKIKSDQTYFWPAKPGKFVVRVVDDHGLSDARDIDVRIDS